MVSAQYNAIEPWLEHLQFFILLIVASPSRTVAAAQKQMLLTLITHHTNAMAVNHVATIFFYIFFILMDPTWCRCATDSEPVAKVARQRIDFYRTRKMCGKHRHETAAHCSTQIFDSIKVPSLRADVNIGIVSVCVPQPPPCVWLKVQIGDDDDYWQIIIRVKFVSPFAFAAN